MKRFISILALAFLLIGCTKTINVEPSGGSIRIVGRITQYENASIETKASKTTEEAKVNNMIMVVCDNTGAIVDKQESGSTLLFVIDKNQAPYSTWNDTNLTQSTICIFANIPTEAKKSEILAKTTLEAMLDVDFGVEGIDIPDTGLPMLGKLENQDLSANSELSGSVLEIPLQSLYAKVAFNITVQPDQVVDDIPQRFQMLSWTVHNVPNELRIKEPASGSETVHAEGTMLEDIERSDFSGSNPVTESSSAALSFAFYMPEHVVNPRATVDYPTGISDEHKQHYKPLRCENSQKPTYVEVEGYYFDHVRRQRKVTYKIYLGEDNWNDFSIRRNCQYNNNITIKGITNSIVGSNGSISVDHRVNVEQTQFKFELERETLLDSHWEIRPIRIELDQTKFGNGLIIVDIEDASNHAWVRMEMPSASDITNNASKYCTYTSTSDIAYGKRRYFTTNLLSEISSGTRFIIPASSQTDHCIWVYIDEYASTTDGNVSRTANLRTRFFANGMDHYNNGVLDEANLPAADVDDIYTLRQKNIHKVGDGNSAHFIEYYEEYLYNFDSKEDHGNTTDGIAWGLNGKSISTHYPAVAMGDINVTVSGGLKDVRTTIENKVNDKWSSVKNTLKSSKKYDFYLSSDVSSIPNNTELTKRDKQGWSFTQEIITAAEIDIKNLTTKDQPSSAVEYCLNKNKRNDDGSISLSNIKWYMPSTDEIEEITYEGYTEFEVFQDKLYWSSQPAYKKYKVTLDGTYTTTLGSSNGTSTATGFYFEDNIYRARATKTRVNGSTVDNVTSATYTNGSEYIWGTLAYKHSFTITYLFSSDASTISNEKLTHTDPAANDGSSATFDEGNCERTSIHRVRTAYKAN